MIKKITYIILIVIMMFNRQPAVFRYPPTITATYIKKNK